MSSNKKTKLKFNFIIICIIGFIVSIFFEFYFISYFPYDYFMLFGIGIIMCIFGYLSIDGVLEIINQTTQKRNEQNEIMIKASKAIYLTTKKIALNGSHSIQAPLESPKDINSLIDDLSQANERLAREVENAVSLQSLVQKNRSIVNNAREIIDDSHEQPLSPLEVEKDLKLDETIVETDFETITQPEAIDSMMEQEVSDTNTAISDSVSAVSEETVEAVGNIIEEENTAKAETISEAADNLSETTETLPDSPMGDSIAADAVSDSSAEPSKADDTVSDNLSEPMDADHPIEAEEVSESISAILSEVKETANNIINNFIGDLNETTAYSETTETPANIPEAEISSEQNPAKAPENTSANKTSAKNENADKPMTAEEIASLFANL